MIVIATTMEQVRIRKDATVTKLEVEPDKLEALQKVVHSDNVTEYTKKRVVRELLGFSPCSCGHGIPLIEIRFPIDGATILERYCEECAKKLYEREAVL